RRQPALSAVFQKIPAFAVRVQPILHKSAEPVAGLDRASFDARDRSDPLIDKTARREKFQRFQFARRRRRPALAGDRRITWARKVGVRERIRNWKMLEMPRKLRQHKAPEARRGNESTICEAEWNDATGIDFLH